MVKEFPMERKSQKEGLTYDLLREKVVAVLCVRVCVYTCRIYTIYIQLEIFLQQRYERVMGSPSFKEEE